MADAVVRMPIMRTGWSIPFTMLDRDRAHRAHGQTLERLAERGGLAPQEALALLDHRQWYRMERDYAESLLKAFIDKTPEAANG